MNSTYESPIELFVPGRLCLLGEHSDWSAEYGHHEGRCLVLPTQQGLFATCKTLKEPVLHVVSTISGKVTTAEFLLEVGSLRSFAHQGGFFSYLAGVAAIIVERHNVGGLYINNHTTTLPVKKGLSSSAAACVLIARAFNELYDLKMNPRGIMEVAYEGERLTPSLCGRMDQAVAYGSSPILLKFKGSHLSVETLPLAAPLYIVLIDLCGTKDTIAILSALQNAYKGGSEDLKRLLGPTNQSITDKALDAMEKGDIESLGKLLRYAQEEFDKIAMPLCPEQLTSPKLHALLNYLDGIEGLVHGCKGVGSQGDGSAQVLCRDEVSQRKVHEILERECDFKCMTLTVLPHRATC